MIDKVSKLLVFFHLCCLLFSQDPPDEFSFNSSENLAFYFVESSTICNLNITNNDWIGAYSPRGICVGARQWFGAYTDIPVNGDNGDSETDGYMNPGEVPYFKIYDSSENLFFQQHGFR